MGLIADFLASGKAIGRTTFTGYVHGGEDEAEMYLSWNQDAWRGTDGAIDWVRSYLTEKLRGTALSRQEVEWVERVRVRRARSDERKIGSA
ncbi:MAG: hypothetical protein F8N36_14155 [Desulfovibrio sp.]|uniref:hypothetical protein n=1 Tax=Desulfovibrio sp. TaxID=885 RepID=UPI00135D60C8|nr:hypothetical protein [Desulfovibrio sp.]MTJ93982.1 hypothetical protein [Desulfovibrio sp.]